MHVFLLGSAPARLGKKRSGAPGIFIKNRRKLECRLVAFKGNFSRSRPYRDPED